MFSSRIRGRQYRADNSGHTAHDNEMSRRQVSFLIWFQCLEIFSCQNCWSKSIHPEASLVHLWIYRYPFGTLRLTTTQYDHVDLSKKRLDFSTRLCYLPKIGHIQRKHNR
ncbi:unnamed protein product [Haemonchus placei]|uniref:Secreted protein n=1 Tax=Haemonchus placei TaxID=6290 RepID=A0A0N4WSL9_HAEPC|nr:unnamed protein product [Haemonchus placei]